MNQVTAPRFAPPPPPNLTEAELQRQALQQRYSAEAADQLQDIQEILDTLTKFAASTENGIVTLRSRAAQYAESMHFARLNDGDRCPSFANLLAPSFSGSPIRAQLEKLVRDLQSAHRELGGIHAELIRFGK